MTTSKIYATMTTKHLTLKEGTKTVFVQTGEDEVKSITEKEYNNIIESSPFFRRLGGSEFHHKTYTCRGYKTWKLSSKNPSRDQQTIRTFDFDVK
ncbi:hypothetical protein VPIG_00065 [Vibrio phage PWH3a-P1]|uniref:hypothetical protein n=1 Tax=Vibrio phage PWH3a-P1 TaxID=754058 RepID=UPI0002C0C208|nr:hypothetical protein VPIG_00065 [Vibrio phage PWH3a-P1]AGH31923.1 hypothetical protein VPIG_00065 [Vibrio phage PWH3a-P1]